MAAAGAMVGSSPGGSSTMASVTLSFLPWAWASGAASATISASAASAPRRCKVIVQLLWVPALDGAATCVPQHGVATLAERRRGAASGRLQHGRLGLRRGRQQRARVVVLRMIEDLARGAALHHHAVL